MSKKTAKAATAPVKVRLDRRVVLAVVAVPAVLVLLWVFFTSNALDARTAAQAAEVEAATQSDLAAARLAGLATGQTPQATGLLITGLALDQLLPQSSDPIALGTKVTSAAAAAGVTLESFDRGESFTGDGGAVAQTFKVSASGSQDQLLAFVSGLGSSGQLLTVPEASVSTAGGRSPSGASVTVAPGAANLQMTLVAWSNTSPMLAPTDIPAPPPEVPVPDPGADINSGIDDGSGVLPLP